MPPLKGIDRGLDGKALCALEQLGHGDQVVIVDPSYSIPRSAEVIDYHSNSSASALSGILSLVPHEKDESGYDIACMSHDIGGTICTATNAFEDVANKLELEMGYQTRKGEGGFYSTVNDPGKNTLFVRTRDEQAFACAKFIVGHSQS